jgi:hypothetical protein
MRLDPPVASFGTDREIARLPAVRLLIRHAFDAPNQSFYWLVGKPGNGPTRAAETEKERVDRVHIASRGPTGRGTSRSEFA